MRYCSNFKCKLWVPLRQMSKEACAGSCEKDLKQTAIVGQCTCCGAASGDCLRCGVQ